MDRLKVHVQDNFNEINYGVMSLWLVARTISGLTNGNNRHLIITCVQSNPSTDLEV